MMQNESCRPNLPALPVASPKLLALALLCALAAPVAGQPKRATRTTLRVEGIKAQVEILIDRWGVPHIYAKSQDDVFFAQGFNAARDRLFQIDVWRRRGLGQLAEVFGPAYVEQDKATRLFLYRGDMYREWLAYGADAKRVTTAFVAGINAYVGYLERNPDKLPFEFKQLGYSPAKWHPEDVVRIRSHGLTRNLTSEVARAEVACKASLKDDAIRSGLQPPWEPRMPEGLDPCLPTDVLKVFRLATQGVRITKEALRGTLAEPAEIRAGEEVEESSEGSNNWAIAPSRSATGRPILANDPHRGYGAPSLRYITHLVAPDMNVIGAGEPALPGISIGHNGTIAFGLTIFSIDQEDLYVYELNPENPNEYRYQNRWEPFKVVQEGIRVRGAESIAVGLQFTRHGPVIHVERDKNRAFAVRSAWMEPGMSPYFGSIDYMRSKSWDQFLAAMNRWGAPTENQVYADINGNIGWAPGGLAPIRSDWDGLLPVPGDGRYEWSGFWDRDQLPSAFNPKQGFVTTSNEMNLPPDYPYRERRLGFEWTDRSRHQRIEEVLTGKNKVSIEDSMLLQNDYLSIPARRLVSLLRALPTTDAGARAALELLRDWDAVEHAHSAQAALMEVWISRHLAKAFKAAVLSKAASEAISTPDMAVMLKLLEDPDRRFGPDPIAKRNELLLTSLAAAYAEMEQLGGSNSKEWRWGKLHHNLCEHPMSGVVDETTRAKLNVGPLPKGGSAYTPNQSGFRASDFRQTGGASFRIIVDLGNWDNSWAVNMPGQSGDPGAKHYRDLAEMWLNGKYFPLRYRRAAVEAVTETRILLMPAR